MLTIGITGGIGCGKSLLVRMIQEGCEYPCICIDTDSIAKSLMEPGEVSYCLIKKHFGDVVIGDDGRIDSKELSKIVMSDEKQLKILNEFTHPYVIKAVKQILNEHKEEDGIAVIESALLLDTHLYKVCDEVWNVTASIEKRIERLCNYRGYTKERAYSIINNQHDSNWYKEHSTRTFLNDADGGRDMREVLNIFLKTYSSKHKV